MCHEEMGEEAVCGEAGNRNHSDESIWESRRAGTEGYIMLQREEVTGKRFKVAQQRKRGNGITEVVPPSLFKVLQEARIR